MHSVAEWLESEEGEEWSFNRHRFSRDACRPWISVIDDVNEFPKSVAMLGWKIDYAEDEREFIPAESGVAT